MSGSPSARTVWLTRWRRHAAPSELLCKVYEEGVPAASLARFEADYKAELLAGEWLACGVGVHCPGGPRRTRRRVCGGCMTGVCGPCHATDPAFAAHAPDGRDVCRRCTIRLLDDRLHACRVCGAKTARPSRCAACASLYP